ncbi:hypothetical protein DXG01_013290 [Tephrocybe rancida]|nr:hypothetical protein DXG01_013290 [Tephrocybe rancida]
MFFNPALILATLVLSVAAGPVAPMVNGTNPDAVSPEINVGEDTGRGDVVAWVSGQSKCTAVSITASGFNPCDIPFTLSGQTFKLGGCGNGLFVDRSNGAFFANCISFSEPDERVLNKRSEED